MNTIGNIAMDLKRAALGSEKTTRIFLREAAKKRSGVSKNVPEYVKKILGGLGNDKELLLMQSILLQNYATRR